MINFGGEDVHLTIKIPAKQVKEGQLVKPLKTKRLLSLISAELKKEGFADIKCLGLYPVTLKLWIVKGDK